MKVSGAKKKCQVEHLATNVVNCQQVSDTDKYLKKDCVSEAKVKMVHQSEKLHLEIVNVPHCNNVVPLNISSSVIQSQKSTLNA